MNWSSLATVARQYGGVYFTHQRSEGDRIFSSLDEVFAISQRAGISATIWHLKTAYRENFGKMPEVLRRIAAARARGIDVAASVYPYTRASNDLPACFPPWVLEGGMGKMAERLADPVQRARAKREMDAPNSPWENEWRGSGGGAGVELDRGRESRAGEVPGDDVRGDRTRDGEGPARRRHGRGGR